MGWCVAASHACMAKASRASREYQYCTYVVFGAVHDGWTGEACICMWMRIFQCRKRGRRRHPQIRQLDGLIEASLATGNPHTNI